ncbi:fizzy-related protein homolog [Corticium candelabrum]|uniref:fizzy-related protein homolog n=1 Tax=Corticium candelabrum TaxID=121492 RepID=UPI002E25AC2E|nr:fizzy-related protein homolog [Corticium candelabrum]
MASPFVKERLCPLSPARQPPCYADRFIPSRVATELVGRFASLTSFGSGSEETQENVSIGKDSGGDIASARERRVYTSLLRNEVLGEVASNVRGAEKVKKDETGSSKMLRYRSPIKSQSSWSPYSLSPVSKSSQWLLLSPRKSARKIPKAPFKILDAPDLQDDFYLNLLDWSSQNVLSVGLGSSVYLWNACSSQVTRLHDLSAQQDEVASVAWSDKGHTLGIGTKRGYVQLWDVDAEKHIRTMSGHTSRVGALAWNSDSLVSGSRDRRIFYRDTRSPDMFLSFLTAHTQEVCGLKWSPDRQHFASGGNDNKLYVWNAGQVSSGVSCQPERKYTEHVAAVKAISWSPHQHGLLVSGGGTTDRCVRFWNTLTGHSQSLQSVDTNSQVCNLAWSKNANELVSTHGYSQNFIVLWKYPSMAQMAKLTGHTTRVLYLAMSPDGQSIVTGAGDETLRFWDIFNKTRLHRHTTSALDLTAYIR